MDSRNPLNDPPEHDGNVDQAQMNVRDEDDSMGESSLDLTPTNAGELVDESVDEAEEEAAEGVRSPIPVAAATGRSTVPIFIIKSVGEPRWTSGRLRHLVHRPLRAPQLKLIARNRMQLQKLGSFRLPALYGDGVGLSPSRAPSSIILSPIYGEILYSLVSDVKPRLVVEAGTGFGISGSYIGAALENAREGDLLTFEVGSYADIARTVISRTTNRALVINDEFEHFPKYLNPRTEIDFAFIDAVHEAEAVYRQLKLVAGFTSSGAVIVVDDALTNDVLRKAILPFVHSRFVNFAARIGSRQILMTMA